jgi:hypothetical protein
MSVTKDNALDKIKAIAPFSTATEAKLCPSKFSPDKATKISPGLRFLVSVVIPVVDLFNSSAASLM